MTLLGVRREVVLEACKAVVLVRIMRRDSLAALLMVPGASCVSCANWRSFVLIVGFSCFLGSLAVPGVWGSLRVIQNTTNPTHQNQKANVYGHVLVLFSYDFQRCRRTVKIIRKRY